MPSLDRFPDHIDEPTVTTVCEGCGAEIYDYERYFRYEDVDFCEITCVAGWLLRERVIEVINDY